MKIGFIGLGIMGKPMAKNLIKAGHELIVFDLNRAPMEELIAIGAEPATSNADIAGQCKIIITMLPDSPQVEEVVLQKGGIIEGAKPGAVLIDMSSISPLSSRKIYALLEEKGIDMLDAPVSGGEPKAVDGTLAVMVGGKREVFDKYYNIIEPMAASVVYVGESGAGNIAKLCNQIVVALNIAAVSEALILAKKAEVDPKLVYKAIRGGLAGSTVMDAKAPMIMDRNFKPGFKIDLHIKDLKNVMETSHSVGVPLLLTSQVMEIMQAIKVDGCGAEDHASIAKFYEKLAQEEISS